MYEDSFNGDTYIFEKFKELVKTYSINAIVETGTYHGQTTDALASIVKKVYTIEINGQYQQIAKSRCANKNNIDFISGSSNEIFPNLLKTLDNNTLFFLDAHWNSYCPLWDEIRLIGEAQLKPIIVVHDFKVPEHPEFGYDHWNGKDLSYVNVKSAIDKVYGEGGYQHFTNTEASGAKRGAGFFIPV